MKQLLLVAGVAALALSGSAFAKSGPKQGRKGQPAHSELRVPVGYGGGGCPPGLARKNPPCVPPGQAKKLAPGQRFSSAYGAPYSYNQIPQDLRRQHGFDPRDRYYYGNGNLYQVDPKTMIVQQVIGALLR